jgi:hypothetical protein
MHSFGAALAFLGLLLGSALLPAPVLGLPEASEFVLVGTGDAEVSGTTIAVSNFQIGANEAAVPMPGLTLVEPIPSDTLAVPIGVTGDGNMALTDPASTFNFSNLDIRGDLGVHCAGSASSCDDGASNTTSNGSSFPGSGLTGDVDFAGLRAGLGAERTAIPALPGDELLQFDGGDWDTSLRIEIAPGLTVFDIDTDGNDLLLQNRNLVIDGPADARAIFRIPDAANFLVSQATILLGDGGIEPGSVLFYTDKPDNDAHFSFSNAVVNGVAFWDLGDASGEVAFDNVQGCTQVIGDKLNLNDVRLTRCAFVDVPEPSRPLLLATAAVMWGLRMRRGTQA